MKRSFDFIRILPGQIFHVDAKWCWFQQRIELDEAVQSIINSTTSEMAALPFEATISPRLFCSVFPIELTTFQV